MEGGWSPEAGRAAQKGPEGGKEARAVALLTSCWKRTDLREEAHLGPNIR